MELTDKKWKAFKIAELFRIEPCKCGNASLLEDGDDVFYRGAKKSENGVMRKVKRVNDLISKGNCIMFICDGDGSCGNTIYIADDFIGSTTTSVGYNNKLNRYTGPFVVSVLDMHKYKYSHSRKYRTSLANEVIMLPIDTNGNPDWEWIEKYMKSLEEGLDDQMNDIMDVADGDKNIIKVFADKVEIDDFKAWLQDNANMDANNQMPLDIDDWKPFITSKLFPYMESGKANQQILEDGTDCFYVGAKRSDNGVMRQCKYNELLITKGNCVVFICNGDGSVGYANYMDKDFIGTTDIIAGYNENLNRPIGLFLATLYSQERFKYSHARKWKPYLKDTAIMLPIKRSSKGTPQIDKKRTYSEEGYVPDWNWIEQYMKSLPYSDK